MARDRYWKLTADELEKINYNSEKLLNWDIKCVREPEDKAEFFGIFQYRHGTPLDYTSIKGIVYHHNNIPRNELSQITKFLKSKFGGKEIEKGERVFLEDSKEIYTGKEIAELAKDAEEKFNTKATITLEFEGLTEKEKEESLLPASKLLPIPGRGT